MSATPGPWIATGINDDWPSGLPMNIIPAPNGQVLATMSKSVALPNRDNARLMAAAPELLAALEKAYTRFGDFTHEWKDRGSLDGQRLLSAMRDAIAAATGRAPIDVQDDYSTRAVEARSKP